MTAEQMARLRGHLRRALSEVDLADRLLEDVGMPKGGPADLAVARAALLTVGSKYRFEKADLLGPDD